jgi:hypothetical protein
MILKWTFKKRVNGCGLDYIAQDMSSGGFVNIITIFRLNKMWARFE